MDLSCLIISFGLTEADPEIWVIRDTASKGSFIALYL